MAGGFFTTGATCEAQKATCLLTVHHLSLSAQLWVPELLSRFEDNPLSRYALFLCCLLHPWKHESQQGHPPSTKKTWELKTAALPAQPVLGEERVPSSGPCLELLWIGGRAQPRTKRPACWPPAEDLEAAFGSGLFFSVCGETKKEQQESSCESSPGCAVTAFLSWEAHRRINLRASDGSKVDGDIRCFLKGL